MIKPNFFLCLCCALSLGIAMFFTSNSFANETDADLVIPSRLDINYAPFSGLPSTEFLQATLNFKQHSSRPEFRVRIQSPTNGKFEAVGGREPLPISLESLDAPRLYRVGNEYRQDWPAGDGGSLELNYVVILPELRFVNEGVYELPIEVDVLDADTQQRLVATKLVVLQVRVEPQLQMNIAGTRGSYEKGEKVAIIDFDELQSGETQQVFIQVRGNALAELKIASENGGVMRAKRDPSLFVDYSVNLDGVTSSLETPLLITRRVVPNQRGSAYKMQVQVGDVERAFAGSYQDIIHISVVPK